MYKSGIRAWRSFGEKAERKSEQVRYQREKINTIHFAISGEGCSSDHLHVGSL